MCSEYLVFYEYFFPGKKCFKAIMLQKKKKNTPKKQIKKTPTKYNKTPNSSKI